MKTSTFFVGFTALLISSASAAPTDDPIADFIQTSNDTIVKLNFFGCSVKPCLLALAPTLVICAAAAAQEELDPINDAACFASAAKSVADKPAACKHCY